MSTNTNYNNINFSAFSPMEASPQMKEEIKSPERDCPLSSKISGWMKNLTLLNTGENNNNNNNTLGNSKKRVLEIDREFEAAWDSSEESDQEITNQPSKIKRISDAAQSLQQADQEYKKGTEEGYVLAAEIYRKSAEEGCQQAAYELGCLYEDADGVEYDLKQAEKYYIKAGDHVEALHNLAHIYLREEVGELKKAIICLIRAVNLNGIEESATTLAEIQDAGKIPADLIEEVRAALDKWYESSEE